MEVAESSKYGAGCSLCHDLLLFSLIFLKHKRDFYLPHRLQDLSFVGMPNFQLVLNELGGICSLGPSTPQQLQFETLGAV